MAAICENNSNHESVLINVPTNFRQSSASLLKPWKKKAQISLLKASYQKNNSVEVEPAEILTPEDKLEFHRLARDLVFCLSIEFNEFHKKHGCVFREHEYRMYKIGELILQGKTPPDILFDNCSDISKLYHFHDGSPSSSSTQDGDVVVVLVPGKVPIADVVGLIEFDIEANGSVNEQTITDLTDDEERRHSGDPLISGFLPSLSSPADLGYGL